MKKWLVVILAAAMVAALAGCVGLTRTRSEGVSASIVEFLYPKGEVPEAVTDEVPRLKVPLTVGLAFVPQNGCTQCARGAGPTATEQAALLQRVRRAFSGRPYIREIRVIPSSYLAGGKGFLTIDQLSRLYGFDVIALVSYDQVAFGSHNVASILYWTIAGMYVIPGNTNEMHTFVDTAVLDVKTRKLLLRAPGTDVHKFLSTAVTQPHLVDTALADGMSIATDRMIANLDTELTAFRERIREDNSVIVTSRDGKGGAGALPAPLLALLLIAALRRRWG